VGLADSVALNFFDTAQYGKPTADWLSLVDQVYQQQERAGRSPTDYAKPPQNATAARPDSAYTGAYANDFYGPLTVTADQGGLTMSLGPKPMRFRLTHYDGDTFSFETVGENATGLSGVTFEGGGQAAKVTVEAWDQDGLGTFTRQ
jgi:hypothetical protein